MKIDVDKLKEKLKSRFHFATYRLIFEIIDELAKEEKEETIEELFKEAVSRFPKGSKAIDLDGNEFTVAKKWTIPQKDNWIEGVFIKERVLMKMIFLF